MKILLALDVSGSINTQKLPDLVEKLLERIDVEHDIEYILFDTKCFSTTLEDIVNEKFAGGGGSDFAEVQKEIEKYDYTYVITDGYVSGLDVKNPPPNVEIILEGE